MRFSFRPKKNPLETRGLVAMRNLGIVVIGALAERLVRRLIVERVLIFRYRNHQIRRYVCTHADDLTVFNQKVDRWIAC